MIRRVMGELIVMLMVLVKAEQFLNQIVKTKWQLGKIEQKMVSGLTLKDQTRTHMGIVFRHQGLLLEVKSSE